jgi:hypothetical protein
MRSSRKPVGPASRARYHIVCNALSHLHNHLFQSVLLLAFDNNAGASERLLQASENLVLQSEQRDAVVTQHVQLLCDIAQPRWLQHICVLNIEFGSLCGEKQVEIRNRAR